jgi:transposase-like protein
MSPGKTLEVLKLCTSGMPPKQACETVGAHYSAISRIKETPGALALFPERTCPVCGGNVPLPLNRKYCCDKCKWTAKYERDAEAKGIKRRFVDYESQEKTLHLYRQGYNCSSIAQTLGISKETAKSRIYKSGLPKEIRPLRHRLEAAKTAEEWAEILRNSETMPERSNAVILVCARLHGSGAPGRYISIASEQFWQKGFYDGVCVAFCNILKNAITTIEWRGENFHLTRTFKTSGTFVWPDEKLGGSIEVTRSEFERLISLKKQAKNSEKPCVHTDFVI